MKKKERENDEKKKKEKMKKKIGRERERESRGEGGREREKWKHPSRKHFNAWPVQYDSIDFPLLKTSCLSHSCASTTLFIFCPTPPPLPNMFFSSLDMNSTRVSYKLQKCLTVITCDNVSAARETQKVKT